MKHTNLFTGLLFIGCISSSAFTAQGQAFRKGSFQINLSDGWSAARYTTNDLYTGNKEASTHIIGDRDPLAIEYGLSAHWGIGLGVGEDFYYITPSAFYGFTTPVNQVKSSSSEFTLNGSYHFIITPRADVSFMASLGASSVLIKGKNSDYTYQYKANGGMLRLGIHARFFVLKHFGLLAILSTYSCTDSPTKVSGNTVGNNYATTVSGISLEGGICYRFKQ